MVSTVPDVQGKGGHIEGTAVAANKEIWRLKSQLKVAGVDINREVRSEEYMQAFERDDIYFSSTVGANIGWRLAGRAVPFLSLGVGREGGGAPRALARET